MKIKEALMNIGQAIQMYRGTLQEHHILQESFRIIADATKEMSETNIVVPNIIPFPVGEKPN